MSLRPGINFAQGSAPSPSGAPSGTGVCFMAGICATGPVDIARLVTSLPQFEKMFGTQVSYGIGWDSAQVFFEEGGASLYFGRLVGPAATFDAHTFHDGSSGNSITVTARGPGVSGLSVAIVAGQTSGFNVVVSQGGVVLEQSYDLALPADAAIWSTSSAYVTIVAAGSLAPAVIGATALSGGADDHASVDDSVKIAALPTLFPYGLGPGQVCIPGSTSDAVHEALEAHAAATNRHALNDLVDTGTAATLITAASTVQANVDDCSYGSAFTPWHIVPGVLKNTTRTVPPSPVVAGLMARRDAQTGDPNKAAAGANGVCRYSKGLSHSFSDADRQALNTAGVNVFRSLGVAFAPAAPRLYGYRTLVNPQQNFGEWVSVGAARLRMAIQYQADLLGEQFIFDEIDGQNRIISAFGIGLTAILANYWALGALYGDTAADAFTVDVGSSVNTPETIEDDQLNAVISMRTSKFAEKITFTVIAVPITQSLAPAA